MLSLLAASCSHPRASSPGEPCRGVAFDADAPDPRCLLPYRQIDNVDTSRLRLRLAKPATVHSGEEAQFILEMQNVSEHMLVVELDDSCDDFEGEASNGRATTFESDCGGLCGRGPDAKILRLLLDPGGVVRKSVRLSATMKRVVANGDECVERTLVPCRQGRTQCRSRCLGVTPCQTILGRRKLVSSLLRSQLRRSRRLIELHPLRAPVTCEVLSGQLFGLHMAADEGGEIKHHDLLLPGLDEDSEGGGSQ